MQQGNVLVRLAALLTLSVAACSQVPVALEPQRRTAQDDAAIAATATSGGLYVGSASGDRVLVEKFSRSGRQPWFRGIAPRPGDDYAELNALEHDPRGDVYALYTSVKTVFGPEFDERIETRFVRRYTATGVVAWTRDVTALNPQGFGYDALGNLYFVVRPGGAWGLVKYSPTGAQLFRRTLGVANVFDFKVLPDGSSRLLDRSSLETGRLYSFSAQGTKLWEAAFAGQAVELAASADGAAFVVGYGPSADPFVNTNVRLAKYAAAGALVWEHPASAGGFRNVDALAPDGQGGVLVGLSGDGDVFVNRFAGDGRQVWAETFASSGYEFLSDIAALGAVEYYLVGATNGSLGGRNRGGLDTFVLRLDGRGNQVWAR